MGEMADLINQDDPYNDDYENDYWASQIKYALTLPTGVIMKIVEDALLDDELQESNFPVQIFRYYQKNGDITTKQKEALARSLVMDYCLIEDKD